MRAGVRVVGRVFQRLAYALYRQRVAVTVVILLVAGFATYELWLARSSLVSDAAAVGTYPVEVTVQDLQGPSFNNQTLTLKEKNGARRISMAVGVTEALAITTSRQGQGSNLQIPKDQQPQAYDLLTKTIQEMGGRVDRVIVYDATQNQYLAQVVISGDGEPKVIPARPGDAVALALQSKAPIFVEDKVLDKFGSKGSG
jgi:bifunctional DNase/RNase